MKTTNGQKEATARFHERVANQFKIMGDMDNYNRAITVAKKLRSNDK